MMLLQIAGDAATTLSGFEEFQKCREIIGEIIN
jgi:hypothetical protein